MKLRLARATDVLEVDALARESGLSLDAARELGLAHSELWVAEQHGEIRGLVLGWFVADELEIVDVAVAPLCRRAGIGGALLDQLLARGRERKAKWAFLEVRASNVEARALYESRGFQRDGERLSYYADGEDAWLFRCCLSAPGETDSAQ